MASATSDRLLLRLSPDGQVSWLGRSGAGVAGDPPPAIVAQARQIVVLVPSEDVLLAGVTLSARSRAQLLRALPFAVEDLLLAPVEEQQFVPVPLAGPEADRLGVLVVARARLRDWLDQLAARGIKPDVLLPETLALAPATALVEPGRVVLRVAPDAGLACPADDLADWLGQAGVPASELQVYDFRSAGAPVLAGAGRYHERQRDVLAFLAAGLARIPANLLEGDFAPAHRGAAGGRRWRLAAALAAVVLLLGLAERGLGVMRLQRESDQLQAAMRESVRQALPELDGDALAGVQPDQLLQLRLQGLRGGSGDGLLGLLAKIAPVLASGTRVQTRGLEYRNGALELGLRAPDVQTLDLLRERLAALPGLRAEITGTSQTGQDPAGGQAGVDARIRISGGGA